MSTLVVVNYDDPYEKEEVRLELRKPQSVRHLFLPYGVSGALSLETMLKLAARLEANVHSTKQHRHLLVQTTPQLTNSRNQ